MGIITISSGKYGFHSRLNFFGFNLDFKAYPTRQFEETAGIRNSTEDGKRLLFLDYDDMIYDEHLIPELKHIQKKYELSEFYIFKSSQKIGSYHVICLDKLKPREWATIIEETNVDNNYKRFPVVADNKAWVLRFLPKKESHKPELISILKEQGHRREKSNAHALFLHYNYGINIKGLKHLDKYNNVMITQYKTLNYIKVKS